MVDQVNVANVQPTDELTEWTELHQPAVEGSPRPRLVEESLPDLAPGLHIILRQAMDQASKEVPGLSAVEPEILWAPHRVRVQVGGDSYETEIGDTLQSLEEALVSSAWALAVGSTEY